jgi:hypothetical protein
VVHEVDGQLVGVVGADRVGAPDRLRVAGEQQLDVPVGEAVVDGVRGVPEGHPDHVRRDALGGADPNAVR